MTRFLCAAVVYAALIGFAIKPLTSHSGPAGAWAIAGLAIPLVAAIVAAMARNWLGLVVLGAALTLGALLIGTAFLHV